MKIIDGKLISEKIKKEIFKEIQYIKNKIKKTPSLTIIIIGNDLASHFYVKNKIQTCIEIEFKYKIIKYPKIKQKKILKIINKENNNNLTHGIIVQIPLPYKINIKEIINQIKPNKDVDGLHPFNYGKMACNLPTYIPATPLGIIKLIKEYKIQTKGKNCVIIGKSQIVGAPLSILMSKNNYPGNATVILCNKLTKNISNFTQKADILISATGQLGLINSKMIKKKSVIIDVGTTLIPNKKNKSGFIIKGDVNFKKIKNKCQYITPVPGGVGPMTVISLLSNTLKSFKNSI